MSDKNVVENTTSQETLEVESFPASREDLLPHNVKIRYTLAAMGFSCFVVMSSLRVNMSLAILAMVNWTRLTSESENECYGPSGVHRSHISDGPYIWSPITQGHILSCYFYGLTATQLLGSKVAERFSPKYVLLLGTLIAAITNFLVPSMADQHEDGYIMMGLQVCKGVGQGIVFPAFSVTMSRWVPIKGRVRFMAIIVSGIPVGAFFTVTFCGIIAKYLSWEYMFYVFGATAVLWCLLWVILNYDSPLKHPSITRQELQRIVSMRVEERPKNRPVPYKEIFKSRPVWAYFAAGFASYWSLCLYMTVIPLFIGTVLKFNIEASGLFGGMPNLAEAFFLVLTSMVSERLLQRGRFTATTIRKTAVSVGCLGFAASISIASITGCHRIPTVMALILALGLSGCSIAATAIVPADIAPYFAGTISGIMNTVGSMSGVIIPVLVGYLTRHAQTMKEWRIVFYISALINLIGAIIFLLFGTSEVQSWNYLPEEEPSQEYQYHLQERIRDREEQREYQDKQPSETEETPTEQPKQREESDQKSSTSPQSTAGEDEQKEEKEDEQKEEGREKNEDRPWRTSSFPKLPKDPDPPIHI